MSKQRKSPLLPHIKSESYFVVALIDIVIDV